LTLHTNLLPTEKKSLDNYIRIQIHMSLRTDLNP